MGRQRDLKAVPEGMWYTAWWFVLVLFFQNCSASNAFSYHKVWGISLSWPSGGSCSEGGVGSRAADSLLLEGETGAW